MVILAVMGAVSFSGIGLGLMYEPCGLDGDACFLLPSSSSFPDHENMGNVHTLRSERLQH